MQRTKVKQSKVKQIKFMLFLMLTPTLWFAMTNFCFAMPNSLIFTPYVGAEIGARVMPFKKEYGDNLTRSVYPQADVFVGLKFNDYVGIETGIETTQPQKRAVLL